MRAGSVSRTRSAWVEVRNRGISTVMGAVLSSGPRSTARRRTPRVAAPGLRRAFAATPAGVNGCARQTSARPPGLGCQRLHRRDRVGLVSALVVAVAKHPGEPQGDPAGVAASSAAARRRRSRRPARGAPRPPSPRCRRPPSSVNRSVCQRSISSVMPLKVLPIITKPPVSGSRAPRWMLDEVPWRRPEPHSTASTTRSRVCVGLTLTQPLPRRPAAYGLSAALTTTPSWPAATRSAKN